MFSLQCPNCFTADELRRSRKRLQDWLLTFVLLEPYRCMGCYHRFYVFRLRRPAKRELQSK